MTEKYDFSSKKINPKIGGERAYCKSDKLTSSYDLVEQMHFLYIELKRVINCPVDQRTGTCIPFVELTLGNYRASTKTLHVVGPNMEWNQVFAFDKTKGDVLEVVLKDGQFADNPVIGKRAFELVVDIPTRVLPDAPIAPQWYTFPNDKEYDNNDHTPAEMLMSIWFGTQADEVYSEAWFSDASGVSADCVICTRPKVYMAPRLCYVRVHIISAHDLIPTDRNRIPEVYVKAVLGKVALKTKVSFGLNPSWNQDLIFVASEPLDDTVFISLMDCVDNEHEECIGKLKIKLLEMTPLKIPDVAPELFYDIELPVKVEPTGLKNFASKIKMQLSTEQCYHVFDECSKYCSDYRAYAASLWPEQLGTLEIGILGATGLQPMKTWKDGRRSTDAYVVAKYGNKWVRTRTVVDNTSPKWNEQYTWAVYDVYTVLTIGVYDNCLIFGSNKPPKDVRIGKVRIRLSLLKSGKIYLYSFPIIDLGRDGVKKMGEIQLAVRFSCPWILHYTMIRAYFSWLLPKMHYMSPLSILQINTLRHQAIHVNCLNLARMEPPLRIEVVQDMLHAGSNSWSIRKAKANFDRLCKVSEGLIIVITFLNDCRMSSEWKMKLAITSICWIMILCLMWWPDQIHSLALFGCLCLMTRNLLRKRLEDPFVIDAELSKLDSIHPDELDEEFDTFPSSVNDINVLRMRYDRMRKMMERVMGIMGDLASLGERFCALVTWQDHRASLYFLFMCIVAIKIPLWVILGISVVWIMQFPCMRNDLPPGPSNFFRRLPTRDDALL